MVLRENVNFWKHGKASAHTLKVNYPHVLRWTPLFNF